MFEHIRDCWNAIEKCMTRDELENLIEEFPRWSGDWLIENVNNYCRVTNMYYDKSLGDVEEEVVDTNIIYDPDYEDLDI